METLNGTSLGEPLKPPPPPAPPPQSPHHSCAEKKRLHRAPSPARPFLKDLHARASSAKPPPVPPKSPSLSGKAQPQQGGARPQSPGLLATQSRLSRRSCAQGAKAAAGLGAGAPGKAGSAKSALSSKKAARAQDQAGGKASGRHPGGEAAHPPGKSRKAKRGAPLVPPGSLAPAAGLGSGPAVRISHTDSSSDLSDCPSEPLSDEQRLAQAASSDAESGTGSSDREREVPPPPPPPPPLPPGPGGSPQHSLPSSDVPSKGPAAPPASPGAKGEAQGEEASWARALEKAPSKSAQPAGSGRLGGKAPLVVPPCERQLVADEEELLREIEELRSENDYLKVNGGKREGRIARTLGLRRQLVVRGGCAEGKDHWLSYGQLSQTTRHPRHRLERLAFGLWSVGGKLESLSGVGALVERGGARLGICLPL
ncbi:microtubule cross-linking factor 1-like [Elgaria multicarinata webbii]|uniref:microtubule cross-linking factor 1-like n=1 Tax=Elgaria multicarinata webbii TaxID=159646 RepID=UPI002FCCF48C